MSGKPPRRRSKEQWTIPTLSSSSASSRLSRFSINETKWAAFLAIAIHHHVHLRQLLMFNFSVLPTSGAMTTCPGFPGYCSGNYRWFMHSVKRKLATPLTWTFFPTWKYSRALQLKSIHCNLFASAWNKWIIIQSLSRVKHAWWFVRRAETTFRFVRWVTWFDMNHASPSSLNHFPQWKIMPLSKLKKC